jgi:hypothetical protein
MRERARALKRGEEGNKNARFVTRVHALGSYCGVITSSCYAQVGKLVAPVLPAIPVVPVPSAVALLLIWH